MLKKDIQTILRESVIDPRKDTAYRFITDLNDPKYCITKVIDMLMTNPSNANLKEAITLLAIARIQIYGGADPR